MAKEFFKNLPDTSTPLNASRLNGLLNGNEAMGNIVVGDVRCKNLFNYNNIASVDHLVQNNEEFSFNSTFWYGNITFKDDFKVNQHYTVSFNIAEMSMPTNATFLFIYTDGTSFEDSIDIFNVGKYSITLTPTKEVSYAELRFFRLNNNTTQRTGKVTDIQVEEGTTTATEYVPYKAFGIESGSNENGSWIKFENGTMICRNTFEVQAIINKPAGGILYYDQPIINKLFPQEFVGEYPQISIEIVNSHGSSGDWGQIQMNYIDLTKIESVVFVDVSSNDALRGFNLSYIAIGRWK